MLEIGMICAEAGEKKTGWLEIEGGGQKLPLTLICGTKEGPTMMISAGVHGAEYIGVQALSELSRELDPRELKGNVICLHVANPSAFRDYVRFFVPEDGKNLNRVFPGKKDGTLSERIAWTITGKLQSKADYYIDLHAGDTSEEYLEAETDGLWYPVFSAGDTFAGGAVLGTVRDIWGNLLLEYRADYPGIVLYQTVSLGVKAGDPLIAYGEYVDR